MLKLDFIKNISSQDSCVIWPFKKDKDGYGWFSSNGQKRAHRVSYCVHKGIISDGLHVLHKCDNPSCVNPSHLFLGTHKQNMEDMIEKGRSHHLNMDYIDNTGSNHPKSLITESQVLEIRSIKGISQKEIGRIYGISRQAVSDIVRRVNWSHI